MGMNICCGTFCGSNHRMFEKGQNHKASGNITGCWSLEVERGKGTIVDLGGRETIQYAASMTYGYVPSDIKEYKLY